jgi:hypothetical protein
MDGKPATVSFGLSRAKVGNHDNLVIVVWQLSTYLCNSGPQIWTHCLTPATMVGDVNMEKKVCSLL